MIGWMDVIIYMMIEIILDVYIQWRHECLGQEAMGETGGICGDLV